MSAAVCSTWRDGSEHAEERTKAINMEKASDDGSKLAAMHACSREQGAVGCAIEVSMYGTHEVSKQAAECATAISS